MNIFFEIEKIFKEKGKRINIDNFPVGIETSVWQFQNFILIVDESSVGENRIVTIVDVSDQNFFYVEYLSPLALKNGGKIAFGIIDESISSPKKIEKILKKLSKSSQLKTGFFIL